MLRYSGAPRLKRSSFERICWQPYTCQGKDHWSANSKDRLAAAYTWVQKLVREFSAWDRTQVELLRFFSWEALVKFRQEQERNRKTGKGPCFVARLPQ